jgi:probable blue pigment (indigoidine) exporter
MPAYPSFHRVPLLVAAAACWGVGTVITKQVLVDVAPLTLLPIQLLASCAFLLLVSHASRTRITWSPPLRRLAALGVLNPGLAYALGLLGLTSMSASMSVLLWATEPVLIVVLAVLLLREHVPATLVAMMAVAVLGVLVVVYRPGASGSGTGVALTVAAVTACALYTVLVRGLLLDDASVSVALVQQWAALGFAVLLAALVQAMAGDAVEAWSLSPQTWLAAAVSGVLYYGLAFWFYLGGLRHVSASMAGSFLTLVPVFGVGAGYLAGERLTAEQWLGAVVVIIAIAVVAVQQSTPDDARSQPAPGQPHHDACERDERQAGGSRDGTR